MSTDTAPGATAVRDDAEQRVAERPRPICPVRAAAAPGRGGGSAVHGVAHSRSRC